MEKRRNRLWFAFAAGLILSGGAQASGPAPVDFSHDEIARILQHGPWPPMASRDPSNRVSGKAQAIAFGEKLFFEPRLSGSGSVLCASCHVPYRAFQDGRPRAFGLREADRNTPSLLNVRFHRWYGWDGAHDSLWSQSLRPLLDPREMNASPAHVGGVLRKLFGADYEAAFERPVPLGDEEVLVDVGKALAAFQETLVSARTPFDEFRDALEKGERVSNYPVAAQRGLRIFVGKGGCSTCHSGPHFTNGEFADTGVPFFGANETVETGRQGGIQKLKGSRFNLLGRHNDDGARTGADGTRHIGFQARNFREFRIPGLRNVALTAPYMHNGSLATLREVVVHYAKLQALKLSQADIDDAVAFLESLSPLPDKQ